MDDSDSDGGIDPLHVSVGCVEEVLGGIYFFRLDFLLSEAR